MPRTGKPFLPIALLGAVLTTAGSVVPSPTLLAAEITGRVTDGDDAPLAGALVTVHPVVGGAERGALWLAGEAHPEPVARARTAADGRFQVEVPDTEPPFWTVVARAEGRLPMQHEVGPLFGALELPPAVLADSEGAAVRVVGADGRPAPGVPVLFSVSGRSPRLHRGPWHPGPFRVARTGPGGRVSLPRVAGETGEVVVADPGRFARAELTGSRLRLELPAPGAPGARHLRAVEPGGRPVPGAVVWGPVADVPRRARVSPRMGRRPLAVTGDDGTALLPAAALAGGAAGGNGEESPSLYVETPAGLSAEVALAPVAPASGDRSSGEDAEDPLVARLAPPAGVRGAVRETGGDPVAGAVVWVLGAPAGAVRSGATGGFALTLPAVERAVLQAAGPGHRQPARQGIGGGAPTSGVDLVLAPTTLFTGRVEDTGGRGIGGVAIEASPDVVSRMNLMATCGRGLARTRADGRFRVAGVSPECSYTVTAEREGYAPGRIEVPPAPDDAEPPPLRLVLSSGHRLTGRVVDDVGAPVPGARVVFQPDQGRHASVRHGLPETVSGPEGLFSLDHLPPSTGGLYASAPGFSLLKRPGIEVPDSPEATDLGDVALEPEAVLEVRVEDPAGEPVAGARVDVRAPGIPYSRHHVAPAPTEPLTDHSGRFRAGGFRAGDQSPVSVWREGYAPESLLGVRVPDDSPLRVVLRPGAVVSGRVADDSGRPVAEAGVSIVGDRSAAMLRGGRGGEVDEEGRFEIRDLPDGALTLVAHGEDGRRSAGVLVELESGERRHGVELVLSSRPKPRILVRVVARDGDPPVRAMVFAHQQGAGGSSCNGPEEGVYACAGRPGLYTVSARAAGVGAGEVEVELGATDVAVDLHLEPELEVSGRVVTADGEPAPGLRVRLHAAEAGSGIFLRAMTASDGSFTLRGLLAGSYRLMVDRDRGGAASPAPYLHPEPVEVAAGRSVTDLLVRLESTTVVRGRLLGVTPEEAGEVRIVAQALSAEGWRPSSFGTVLDGGRYEVRLAPGTWRIAASEARGGKRGEAEVAVAPGETERIVDLDLSPALTVTGVARLGGEPWSGAVVESMQPPYTRGVTDLGGRFEIHGLEPGRQELMVRSRDHRLAVRHELVPAEDREIVIDVEVGRVRGTVLSSVGVEPVADADVRLVGAGPAAEMPMPMPAAPTTADGRFLVDRVPVGSYTLTIEKPGHLPFTTELRVPAGELELPPVVLEPAPL